MKPGAVHDGMAESSASCENTSLRLTAFICNCGHFVGTMWAALLEGDPITVPALIAAVDDPSRYDLSGGAAQQPVVTARQQPPPLPPAGWYDDPGNPHAIRYWTGTEWTHHTATKPAHTR